MFRTALVAVFAVAAFVVPRSTSAQDRPVHLQRTLPAFFETIPAGELCDFAFQVESHDDQTITRFLEGGVVVRVIRENDQVNYHRNLDTGAELVEQINFVEFIDLVAGTYTLSGQTWHLRTQDGRLVVSGAGRYVQDLETGEILASTPDSRILDDFAALMCPRLGGAPAK